MKRSSVLVAAAALLAGALTTQPAESVAAPASAAARIDARALAPSNDAFAARTPLVLGSVVLADNVGATSEPGEPDRSELHGPECASVDAQPACGSTSWFTFTAPSTASYVIDSCDSPNTLDTVLEVFTGTAVSALTPVVYNDDGPASSARPCGSSSSLTLSATAGTAYSVRLSGYSAQEGTTYVGVFAAASVPPGPVVSSTVAAASPAAPIDFTASSASGGRRSASFSFAATPAGTATPCALDGAALAPCTSPVSYPVADDPGARHVFRVQAAGDPTPEVVVFAVDRAAPDTVFPVAPAEGSSVALPGDVLPAALDPRESRGVGNRASCAIDGIALSPCVVGNFPFHVSADLCAGSHTSAAQAFDHAGNLDPTPAVRTFTTTANQACGAAPTLADPTATPTDGSTYLKAGATVATGSRYGEFLFELGPTAGEYTDGGRTVVVPSDGTQPVAATARVTPGQTYHYRLTVRTATGSSTSGDQVVTVPPVAAGTSVQSISPGVPVVVGPSALSIPVTVIMGAPARDVTVKAFVSAGPVVIQDGYGRSADAVVSASSAGSTTVQIPLVDVEPGQVIHYRIFSLGGATTSPSTGTRSTIGPDLTFTVPAPPVVPPVVVLPTAPPYTLAEGQVSVRKLKHSATKVKVTVTGLPAAASVSVSAKGKKLKAALPAATVAAGPRTFVLKLSTKARKALAAKALKKLKVTVAVTPAGGTRQQVTLKAPVA